MKNKTNRTIEKVFEKAVWHISKYASQADKEAGKLMEMVQIDGNALVNEGINELLTILGSAASGTKYDNTNAYLIVGTGSGAADPTDTEVTFTAGVKVGMEAGYPTYGTDQKITWKSSYGGDTANQAWNEFGVLNAASSGKLLNRKVSAQGTKTSGQVWDLELEITLS
jgi:hypothetical protein